jgi:hypothetical protein
MRVITDGLPTRNVFRQKLQVLNTLIEVINTPCNTYGIDTPLSTLQSILTKIDGI